MGASIQRRVSFEQLTSHMRCSHARLGPAQPSRKSVLRARKMEGAKQQQQIGSVYTSSAAIMHVVAYDETLKKLKFV